MSMRFRILGSSSKGNAALLITEHSKVLIDAGFSARRLTSMLEAIGESIESIHGIFITHEHSDHTAGLRGLAKRNQIKIFANRDTAAEAQRNLRHRPNWQIFETGSTFKFRDIEVSSFSIPHDAADPVGFTFVAGEDTLFSPLRKLAWCTDLGYAPKLVQERIRDADILVLEANYERELLEASPRSWSLKQRIMGRFGHLCNDATLELLEAIESPRWQHIYLAHLSDECNCPKRVLELFSPFSQARKIALSVVDPVQSALPELHLGHT